MDCQGKELGPVPQFSGLTSSEGRLVPWASFDLFKWLVEGKIISCFCESSCVFL